jgi:hypothetical protein
LLFIPQKNQLSLKKICLAKKCEFNFPSFDSEAAVEKSNKSWKIQEDLANIKYYCKNILVDEINNSYSTLLLFQMDYVFSDVENNFSLSSTCCNSIGTLWFWQRR